MPRPPTANGAPKAITYASSGVNLEEKDRFTESLESVMRRTHGPRVIPNPGGFAGLFRLDFNERLFKKNYREPVLVACTDGVGTKVKLASAVNRFDTIGIDLVAMSVNDLIVQGAEPLFFLDYIAVSKVSAPMLTDIVKGVAEGCRLAGCALLGGETAEMPGVYNPGEFDLAGFAVGVVELKRAIDPGRARPGDIVLGLASDGIHSNGYSLVRRVVDEASLDLGAVYPELDPGATARPALRRAVRSGNKPKTKAANRQRGKATNKEEAADGSARSPTLGEVLLTPTRLYAAPIVKLQKRYTVKKVISGMAHITGSGLAGNLERALNPEVDAVIDTASWPVPPVFSFLQARGRIPDDEMRRVFNMGIGYCLVVRPAFADAVAERLTRLGERAYRIGIIKRGKGMVREE